MEMQKKQEWGKSNVYSIKKSLQINKNLMENQPVTCFQIKRFNGGTWPNIIDKLIDLAECLNLMEKECIILSWLKE